MTKGLGMEQRIVKINGGGLAAKLYGAMDVNMKLVEAAFGVTVHNRSEMGGDGEALTISGNNSESVESAARAIECLSRMGEKTETLAEQTVIYVINMVRDGREGELEAFDENCICVSAIGPDGYPAYREAKIIIECKLIAASTVSKDEFYTDEAKTFLQEGYDEAKDWHKLVYGEITNILIKK